jgi:hypothetical protein
MKSTVNVAAWPLLLLVTTGVLWSNTAQATDQPEVATQLAIIAQVGPQGTGSDNARLARDTLAKRGVEILPALLEAMDTSNAVAANWYRTVFDEIVNREAMGISPPWPKAFLQEYVGDSQRAGRPRRLALALLERCEPGYTALWIPTRLGDPEFGYEAVAQTLVAAEQSLRDKHNDLALRQFRQAFEYARDSSQVAQAAAKLKTLGETVDAVEHLGLVVNWWLVGPFDAPDKTGFAQVFEPERRVDLAATYAGKNGQSLTWRRYQARDKLGQLNLIEALGTTSEAVAYAYAEIDVPQSLAAQVRCGADDNCAVWLNGHKVFGREQWLNGTRFDRFITAITLTAGKNVVLVKICQGPQHRDPEAPNPWSLQLRLCDEQGRGLKFRQVSPDPIAN